jgi:hypothetical protein
MINIEKVPGTSVIFNQLTMLIAKDFITFAITKAAGVKS